MTIEFKNIDFLIDIGYLWEILIKTRISQSNLVVKFSATNAS